MSQYDEYANGEYVLMQALEAATTRADRRFAYGGELLFMIIMLPLILALYWWQDPLAHWIGMVLGNRFWTTPLLAFACVLAMVLCLSFSIEFYEWYIWRDAMRLRRQLYRLRLRFYALSTP